MGTRGLDAYIQQTGYHDYKRRKIDDSLSPWVTIPKSPGKSTHSPRYEWWQRLRLHSRLLPVPSAWLPALF